MKLCDAAALALVGWYLMLPPPQEMLNAKGTKIYQTDTQAPLNQWRTLSSYDSATKCRKGIVQLLAPLQIDKSSASAVSMAAAKCVSSDDPRLKGN